MAGADGEKDPELADVDDLRRVERARGASSRRARRRGAGLILLAVLVLVALAAASLWVVARG